MPLGPTQPGGTAELGGGYLGPETGIKPTTGTMVTVLVDTNVVQNVSETFVLDGFDTMSVQAATDAAWGSTVLTLQVSLDGQQWADTATTITADGLTRGIDIVDVMMGRFRVSTAAGAAKRATLIIYMVRASK